MELNRNGLHLVPSVKLFVNISTDLQLSEALSVAEKARKEHRPLVAKVTELWLESYHDL